MILSSGLIALSSAVVWVVFRLSDGNPWLIGVSLALILVGALMIWVSRRKPDHLLDRRVGLVLEGMTGTGFVVLRDLQLDNRRLDHVVIGPPGVFVVRTAPTATGIIRRDSRDRNLSDVLTELHQDVTSLGSHVKPPVKPLLVTARDLDLEVPDKESLVSVARLEELLRSESPRLDQATVRETMTQVLLAATTTRPAPADGNQQGMNFA